MTTLSAPVATGEVVLELRAARKVYTGTPPVESLRGVDLMIRAGERVAIVGVGAEYSATLCDLGVFMNEPAESISSYDLDFGVDGVG